MLNRFAIAITTDADGAATVYSERPVSGKVVAVKYEPGTLDTGADLTLTGETTAWPILSKANAGTSDAWFYPVIAANLSGNGAASSLTEVAPRLFSERAKLVVAQGGNGGIGTLNLFVDEDR